MAVKTKNENTATESAGIQFADEATAKAFDIKPHLVAMMLEEPFYGKVLRRVTKIPTTRIRTAGVLAKDGDIRMWFNKAFLAALPGRYIRGVMKHEMLHLIFEHTTTRKFEPHIIWNYATDLAINSHLEGELPDFGLFPGKAFKALTEEDVERMGKEAARRYQLVSDTVESFPPKMAAEWYFARLMEDKDVADSIQNPNPGQPGPGQPGGECDGDGDGEGNAPGEGGQPGEGGTPGPGQGNGPSMPGTLDDHEGWGDMSDEDRELVKAKIKQAAGEAAKECDSKGQWGSVPADLRRAIKAALVKEVPWQKILDRFCGYSRRANRTTSYSRLHSTMGRLVPGAKRSYTSSVAAYIDQSGSVSDAELALCFGELMNLAKSTEFTCYHFDTEVDEESKKVWKRKGHPAHRTRGGGTCFEAPSKHAAARKRIFDGYIILTDGYAADPGPSRLPRAWVITPDGAVQDWMTKYKKDVIVKMRWPKTLDRSAA
jgi:predicted metal-dependent peptidase